MVSETDEKVENGQRDHHNRGSLNQSVLNRSEGGEDNHRSTDTVQTPLPSKKEGSRTRKSPPTAKQLAFIESLARELGIDPPPSVDSWTAAAACIDELKAKAKAATRRSPVRSIKGGTAPGVAFEVRNDCSTPEVPAPFPQEGPGTGHHTAALSLPKRERQVLAGGTHPGPLPDPWGLLSMSRARSTSCALRASNRRGSRTASPARSWSPSAATGSWTRTRGSESGTSPRIRSCG